MNISEHDQKLNEYDDYLDATYSFESAGELFANMKASQVLKTCDINLYNNFFHVWRSNAPKKENDAQNELSENQKQFVHDAESQGLDVYYTYSGRCMYGKTCPAVNIESIQHGIITKAKSCIDNMGRGFVIYCPN